MAGSTNSNYDNRRYKQEHRAWYRDPAWKRNRLEQLRKQPLCERCLTRGVYTLANVAHHVVPHKGDYNLFWNGELASSCESCHNIDEQRIERGGKPRSDCDDDGWPKG